MSQDINVLCQRIRFIYLALSGLLVRMLLTPEKSLSFQTRLREAVEVGLKKKGISGRKASLDIVGNDGLVRDIRAGVLPSADRILALFEYLGEMLPVGSPVGPTHEQPPDPDAYAQVPIHDAFLSAGPGLVNGDAEVIGHLAFRRDWLTKVGISPGHARVARVDGDSMAPGIRDGDLVLINTARTLADVPKRPPGDTRPCPIYAFKQDGEARVKRLERLADRALALLSDNPTVEVKVIDPSDRDFELLGQVVWSGHVWR